MLAATATVSPGPVPSLRVVAPPAPRPLFPQPRCVRGSDVRSRRASSVRVSRASPPDGRVCGRAVGRVLGPGFGPSDAPLLRVPPPHPPPPPTARRRLDDEPRKTYFYRRGWRLFRRRDPTLLFGRKGLDLKSSPRAHLLNLFE